MRILTLLIIVFGFVARASAQQIDSFTDARDGKTYKIVTIGEQVWMAQDLAYKPSSGNYWAYNNDPQNVEKYGYLYSWQTAQNVCPTGWSLPSKSDWDKLRIFLGDNAGKLLNAQSGWDDNKNGSDKFGFAALPGGYFIPWKNEFRGKGGRGNWWSSTQHNEQNAYSRYSTGYFIGEHYRKDWGFAVRCIKVDNVITVKYDKNAGCGTFYSGGKELKTHCGWHKNWHSIVMVGCLNAPAPSYKFLFYDKSTGFAEIYRVNQQGDMSRLQSFNNFSKHWTKISWVGNDSCSGLIKFEQADGYWENYWCDENGNIKLHSKYGLESFFTLKNRWKGGYLNIEYGLASGDITPGWHSAMWVFEPVEGTNFVKIKNRWKGTYLNVENGFGCTEISPGWHSAMWEIEPVEGANYVKIKNRWKGTYINIENGLSCTDIAPGWHSAMWEIDYNVPK